MGNRLGPDTYESLDEHMDSVYYLLEVVCAEILEDPMDKFTIVYNRLDIDSTKSDNEWVKEIGKALADHYPERMKRCLVYPTNTIFRYIWNIVKIFFDPVTAAKIQFVGTQEDLYKWVDKDQLLMCVGGTDPYVYDPSHVQTKGMISDEVKNMKRVAPKAQTVYDFLDE